MASDVRLNDIFIIPNFFMSLSLFKKIEFFFMDTNRKFSYYYKAFKGDSIYNLGIFKNN